MGILTLTALVLMAYAIAHFFGKKRYISFGWSFFFCLFLSPLIGFFITIGSDPLTKPKPKASQALRLTGAVVLFASIAGGINQFFSMINENNGGENISLFLFSIGFSGLGYYLYELGKGKVFNTRKD